MYTKEQLKWIIFFRKMAEGKIPHQRKFYCIDDHVTNDEVNAEYQTGGEVPTIQLVTPTQQQVEQAKVQIKREVEEGVQRVYKRKPLSGKRKTPY